MKKIDSYFSFTIVLLILGIAFTNESFEHISIILFSALVFIMFILYPIIKHISLKSNPRVSGIVTDLSEGRLGNMIISIKLSYNESFYVIYIETVSDIAPAIGEKVVVIVNTKNLSNSSMETKNSFGI